MSVAIRAERLGDQAAIAALITDAFETAPHAGGNEARIVDSLREAGALSLSLVAEDGDRIVGHVAFSPVTIAGADCGWFGLGPVAVLSSEQGRGIGQALVKAGLDDLRGSGAKGCVVVGEPSYYNRFGFRADPRLTYAGLPPEYFQALRFTDVEFEGTVAYHPAFA